MAANVLVTLHLRTVAPLRVPAAVARMGLDRRHLARSPGLRFAKLLGTGDGRTFDLRDADPLTWGLLTVWEDAASLAAFERSSPIATAWAGIAREAWRADLALLSSRGRWQGREPFGPPLRRQTREGGPVAALTRARLRRGRMRTFWRAVPPVVADLHGQPGLLLSVGVGEAPFGLQGTFSVWESADALTAFAYRRPAHREAIRRTEEVGWYSEELFARFAVLQTTGTLWGGDPLAAVRTRAR